MYSTLDSYGSFHIICVPTSMVGLAYLYGWVILFHIKKICSDTFLSKAVDDARMINRLFEHTPHPAWHDHVVVSNDPCIL